MLVLDTNVLVYACVEDSRFHGESLELLNERDVVIPQIVVYEFIRVIAELVRDPSFVLAKLRELSEFNVVCEPPYVLQRGLEIWIQHGAPARELNDFVILSLALSLGAHLATYDRKLRRLAEEHGVPTLPREMDSRYGNEHR